MVLYSETYTCESKREHPTQYLTAWTRNALFCDFYEHLSCAGLHLSLRLPF